MPWHLLATLAVLVLLGVVIFYPQAARQIAERERAATEIGRVAAPMSVHP